MNYKIILLSLLMTLHFCSDKKQSANDKSKISSPYKTFFHHLKLENLTDTVLIQNTTKTFGCGTAYTMYINNLEKTGLNKFYKKYGDVLSDRELITVFANKHKVKILWIEIVNGGALLQLEDTILHKNTKLENRLIKEKTHIKFNETPKSMNNVTISVLLTKNKEQIYKSFELAKKRGKWIIEK